MPLGSVSVAPSTISMIPAEACVGRLPVQKSTLLPTGHRLKLVIGRLTASARSTSKRARLEIEHLFPKQGGICIPRWLFDSVASFNNPIAQEVGGLTSGCMFTAQTSRIAFRSSAEKKAESQRTHSAQLAQSVGPNICQWPPASRRSALTGRERCLLPRVEPHTSAPDGAGNCAARKSDCSARKRSPDSARRTQNRAENAIPRTGLKSPSKFLVIKRGR